VPSAHAVALLVDAKNAGGGDGQEEIENAARTGGPKLQVLKASNAQEIDQAFSAMVQMRPDALLIVSSPLFTNSRHQIVTLANHHRIPAIYPLREYVLAGGLLSYGASIVDAYRQSGVYTGRILQGAKASDLPIQQPTKFELLINLKAAKTSGIEIPAGLLARADEVID
jgi:putative ABC transport system substrate-binding protein